MIGNAPEVKPRLLPLETADSWFGPWRFALILFLLLFAAYPEVVTGLGTFFYRDFSILGYPWAQYQRDCFWHGELPLWNPLNNCGNPFLAEWGTLTLYPLALVYLLFPLSWSLGVFCLGHIFIAGLGMYFLARRWTGSQFAGALAGVALAFNGMTINALQWPAYCATLGWMPWVVLLGERAWREGGVRNILAAVLVGTLQMLAGVPELILLTWLLMLALHLGQWVRGRMPRMRGPLRFGSVAALIGALAAIQLLPFLDFLSHSQRDTGFGQGGLWSMPGSGWANLLVPLFYSFEWTHGVFFQYDQYCTSSYYAGIGVLALAVAAVWLGRQLLIWFLGGVCLLSLILAMGEHSFLYRWVREALPALGFMRYPVKFVLLPTFLLPLLAGFGVARALSATAGERPGLWRRLAMLGVLLAGLIGLILWFAQRFPQHTYPLNRWPETLENGLSRLGFLVLAGGLLWWAGRTAPVRRQGALRLGLLLAIWLDLLTHVPRQNPTVPRWVYRPGVLQLSPQPKIGATRAMTSPAAELALHKFVWTNAIEDVLSCRQGLYCECNLIDGIPKVAGYSPLVLREAHRFNSVLYATADREYPQVEAFLGVSHVNVLTNVLTWETRTNYLPLVTAGQRPVFAGDDEALRAVFAPDFDPRRVVYLPLEAKSKINVAAPAHARLEVRRFSAQRIKLETESEQPTMVVVAQSYYHRWQAYVDGNRVPLWRANYAFQALEVPKGRHQVIVVYKDTAFRIGAVISAMAVAGCLFAWRTRNRRKGPAEGTGTQGPLIPDSELDLERP